MEIKPLTAEHMIGQFLLPRYQKKRVRVCFGEQRIVKKLVYFSLAKYFGFINMNQTVNPDFVIFRDTFARSQIVFF